LLNSVAEKGNENIDVTYFLFDETYFILKDIHALL